MRYRQVHLDFHTSEKIKNIGKEFSKEQFQNALKAGHVDSITVFSKCHHGWAYHPSKANEMHPNLDFDLLGAQIEAAHEINVKTPVYISAGYDEKAARRHPEWVVRNMDESTVPYNNFANPGFHKMCFNTPYLDYLLNQIKEVCENYDADGIFLDIVGVQPCYCQSCVQSILKEGKDPYDEKNVLEQAEKVYADYCRRVRETIDSVKPGLNVFHNSGHIKRGRRDLVDFNSHLELESLPTGGWGYDHFPLSAAYARTLNKDFLGMTGKFHGSWGEFGGYKHPDALRYEVALSALNGAKCSIGDQLHPSGKMDENTYYIIGKAYEELEKKERWLKDAVNIADVAILSYEAFTSKTKISDGDLAMSDAGAVRILNEGKYLYNVIDCDEDFDKYKVIVLPDGILINPELKEKLKSYTNDGGKILATGKSGLNFESNKFELDFGAEYDGQNEYRPDYFRPCFKMDEYKNAAFVMYSQGQKIKITDGEVIGLREDPYFNRSALAFCSHRHTPSSGVQSPAMVLGKDGIYISWNVFEDYAARGSFILKKMVQYALDTLLGDRKTLQTNLMPRGIVTLTQQENRFIVHTLYASPVKKGDVEVIEDIAPIYNTTVGLKTDKNIKSVYIAPDMEPLDFKQSANSVNFTIPYFENHAMIVLEY